MMLLVIGYLLSILAFLSLWQLSRLADLPLMARRALFCALGTLILAPMVAPAGGPVVYVPNGLILLILADAGAPIGEILGDYLGLWRFSLPSLGITATVFALMAWRVVRAEAKPLRHRWVALALPAVLLVGIFQVYRFVFPDGSIPDALDNSVVEQAYGTLLNEVGNLLRIADPEEQRAEVARLQAAFESDPVILAAVLYELGQSVQGQPFSFSREQDLYVSESCSNKVQAHRDRLARCTRKYAHSPRRDLLQYDHPYDHGGQSWIIKVYFEYDDAIDLLL